MSFTTTIKTKLKTALLLLVTVFTAFVISGCGNGSDEYVGTWMGLDEVGYGNSKIYEYKIEPSDNGVDYTICVTQYDYEISLNHSSAVWRSTMPHYFNAHLNNNGDLISDIGLIHAEPQNFRLVYGNIFLVRKAKNTEVKFKYVLRREIEAKYPGIIVVD